MSIRLTLLPVLAAGLLATTPLVAQTPATTAAPVSTAAPVATHRDVMVERRITDLHTKLKITAAEQKPFDEFAQAMRDNASRMDDMVAKRRVDAASATAVEQMKAYADMARPIRTRSSTSFPRLPRCMPRCRPSRRSWRIKASGSSRVGQSAAAPPRADLLRTGPGGFIAAASPRRSASARAIAWRAQP